jgi:acetyl esterase/lipase
VAAAVAQLAVTGRHALDFFMAWHPQGGALAGPQDADLMQLAQGTPAAGDPAALQAAVAYVLDSAYAALWAIRSNDLASRVHRTQMGWIAVSGEDDTPHRPVNVSTAPYPQYDLAVTMNFAHGPAPVRTRYMIATAQNFLPVPDTAMPSSRGLAPAGPTRQSVSITLPPPNLATQGAAPAANPMAAAPMTNPPVFVGTRLPPPVIFAPAPRPLPGDVPSIPANSSIIIYVHGGGSRLEEAVPLAKQLIAQGAQAGQTYTVISLDMPNSAYGDSFDPVAIDPATANPFYDATNFPILNFDETYLIRFIETLDQQFGNIKNRIVAVMGGSLGGNLSLLSASLADPGHPYFKTIVAWSPTAMIKTSALSRQIIASPAGNLKDVNWGLEKSFTRHNYMHNLYFEDLNAFLGMPADPILWYRGDYVGTATPAGGTPFAINCRDARVSQSRFDRYEIYSPQIRRWTTALDTEQAILDFRLPDPATGAAQTPRFLTMKARLLLAVGHQDCISCNPNATPLGQFVGASAGAAAGFSVGSFVGSIFFGPAGAVAGASIGATTGGVYGSGVQSLMNVDIQGYTHDVATLMINTPGRTLFMDHTGHSIHDERPIFFAHEIVDFLTQPDTNLQVNIGTGGDDLRWNSQAWAVLKDPANQTVVLPLNQWWHPWNANPPAADNPCGLCAQLNTFALPNGSSASFTVGLSRTPLKAANIQSFGIQFVGGQSAPLDSGDNWNLQWVNLVSVSGPAGPGIMVNEAGTPLKRLAAPQDLWQTTHVTAPTLPLRSMTTSIASTGTQIVAGRTHDLVTIRATDSQTGAVLNAAVTITTAGYAAIAGGTTGQSISYICPAGPHGSNTSQIQANCHVKVTAQGYNPGGAQLTLAPTEP